MMPTDFIYNSVLNGCRDAGLTEYASTSQANEAVTLYKRNQYTGKPSGLIKDQILIAKKINKKVASK